MSKVDTEITPTKPTKEVASAVGLSYSPYLTAKVLFKRYSTGETVIRFVPSHLLNLESKPPINTGERIQEDGLSRRGRRRIRQAAQLYQSFVEDKQTEKAYASFITLTYGKHYPDHETAKKHLDSFLKRLRRIKGKPLHYCWVAELQKRGAIHFHILTPEYVDKEWINKAWNGVVNGYWKRSEPSKMQQLYPHVVAVYSAGAYMAKYVSKKGERIKGNGYNMSQLTSADLKPTFEDTIELDISALDALSDKVRNLAPKSAETYEYEHDTGVKVYWFSDTVALLFDELTNEYLIPPRTDAPPQEKRRKKALDSTTYSRKRIQGACGLFKQDKHPVRKHSTKRYSRLSKKAQRAHRATRHRPESNEH